MADTTNIAPLPSQTREYLDALAVRARDDKQAAQELVRTLLRFVEAFARRTRKGLSDEDLEDLTAAGLAGLWDATQNYDPANGSFTNYAAWWIKKRMYEEHRKRSTVTLTKNDLRKGHRTQVGLSLDSQINDAGDTVAVTLPDESAVDPDVVIQSETERRVLHEILAGLSERSRRIIVLRMEGMTLQQVGDELGLTRERVRQIEAKEMQIVGILIREALGDRA